MNLRKTITLIILCYIGCVIIFDIAGVLLVSILPEPGDVRLNGHAGFGSVILYYAVWLVAGGFAGAFFTSYSLEITKANTQMQRNPVIVFVIALLLSAGLIFIFYSLNEMQNPRFNYNNDYYVPGHRNVTFTFFIAFLLMNLFILRLAKKEQKP